MTRLFAETLEEASRAESPALRQAALLLHAMPDRDRSWAMARLSSAEQLALSPLLAELQAMGFSASPEELAGLVGAGGSSELSARQRIAAADPAHIAQMLMSEPAGLVRSLIAVGPWPWSASVLAILRARRGAAFANMEPHADAPHAPELERALLAALAARLPGQQASSASPFARADRSSPPLVEAMVCASQGEGMNHSASIMRSPEVAAVRRTLTLGDATTGGALRQSTDVSAVSIGHPSSDPTMQPETQVGAGGLTSQQVELALQQALEQGHAAGLKQGLADADARIAQEVEARIRALQQQAEQSEARRTEEHTRQLQLLEAVLQAVQKALPERFMVLERQAVELAYESLCKILGPQAEHPVHGRASLLTALLQQGIRQLRGQAWLGVRLSTQDHAALMASDAGQGLRARYPEVPFMIDPALGPLDVLIDADHGQLDVGLQTQLARLRELWLQTAGVPGSDERAGGQG